LAAVPMVARRWACGAHLALIAILSLLPAWMFPPSAAGIPGIDKVAHVAMYGVLGILLRWAAGDKSQTRDNRPETRDFEIWMWGLPLAGAGYGLLMELLQLGFSGGSRMFSWWDAAANLAGVVLFWWVADWMMGKSA